MDYPLSDSSVNLLLGKYTDGNPLTSTPASRDDAVTYNRIIDSILAVQTAGGLTHSEANTNQLRDAIIELIRARTDKIVRVASTVAINLAAPGANIDGVAMVAGDAFLEKDHGTGSSRGVYIWNGAAVPATRAAWADDGTELTGGMLIKVQEGTVNGDTVWQLTTNGVITVGSTALAFSQINQQAQSSGVQGAFSNLKASANGTSANVSITFDELVLETTSNQYLTVRAGNLALNTAGAGANGLDTGVLAASTWYYLWVINNGSTTAALLSLSATAPTMPGGYTYKARVGAIRTDSSGNKYPLAFKQAGRDVQYIVAAATNVAAYPQMAAQTTGLASTWQAVSMSNYVPVTAARIRGSIVSIFTTNSANISASPNNQTTAGSVPAYANPMPLHMDGNNTSVAFPFDFAVESTNIYWCGAGGTNSNVMMCVGWQDNI